MIQVDRFKTPVGLVLVAMGEGRIRRLELGGRTGRGTKLTRLVQARGWIRDWFRGRPSGARLRIEGTPFLRRVYAVVRSIPPGQTRTYGQVARAAGRPGAARAVGQAMARNPICLFIPCHRVVGASGLGGFSGSGGLPQKRQLLALERGRKAPRGP